MPIALGILPRPKPTKKSAEKLRKSLENGPSGEKLDVGIGLFVRAVKPANLLCLIGLNSSVHSNWKYIVRLVSMDEWTNERTDRSEQEIAHLRKTFGDTMRTVSGQQKP